MPHYQIIRVDAVHQELAGDRLYSRVVSSVLPLDAPMDDVVATDAERAIASAV